jgi:VTC domain.
MMQSQQIPMTFQRYETKYMLSPIMARKLRKSLPGHLQMDEYGLDTICSLYYDTPDHQLIRRSLEKPVYKEKLRLRSYGPVKETSPIYVELKKNMKESSTNVASA